MCKFNEFHQHFLELERLLRCISKSFISACFLYLFKMFFYLCFSSYVYIEFLFPVYFVVSMFLKNLNSYEF